MVEAGQNGQVYRYSLSKRRQQTQSETASVAATAASVEVGVEASAAARQTPSSQRGQLTQPNNAAQEQSVVPNQTPNPGARQTQNDLPSQPQTAHASQSYAEAQTPQELSHAAQTPSLNPPQTPQPNELSTLCSSEAQNFTARASAQEQTQKRERKRESKPLFASFFNLFCKKADSNKQNALNQARFAYSQNLLNSNLTNFNGGKNDLLFNLILICAATFLAMLCRIYWVDWALSQWWLLHNGAVMISTNDGYYFAEGARDLLEGGLFTPSNQPNDLSPVNEGLSLLTYFCVKIANFFIAIYNFFLGFFVSKEELMSYSNAESILTKMSVIFGASLAIPTFLFARELGSKTFAFLAALLAPIAVYYFTRTMGGYYDTDFLVITLPMFFAWGLVRLSVKKDTASLFVIALSGLIAIWFYHQSFVICAAQIGIFLLYTLVFERKNPLFYFAIILAIISVTNINFFVRFAILLALFAFYFARREECLRPLSLAALLLLALVSLSFSDSVVTVFRRVANYITRTSIDSLPFYFFDVYRTIAEAGKVSLGYVIDRLGGKTLFALSSLGLLWLFVRRPVALLILPFLVLSLLSVKAGGRFIMYGDIAIAIGIAYLVASLAALATNQIRFWQIFDRPLTQTALQAAGFVGLVGLLGFLVFEYANSPHQFWLTYGFKTEVGFYKIMSSALLFGVLGAAAYALFIAVKKRDFAASACVVLTTSIGVFLLNPLVSNAMNWRSGSVMHPNEIRVIEDVAKVASPEDYIVSWWDYGYPLRFFANTKTLVDGAKHSGANNFAPSFVFARDQVSGVNMARLDVEYTEKAFHEPTQLANWIESNIFDMTIDYGYTNIDEFLKQALSKKELQMPQKTREVFIYIPQSMLRIMGTVFTFSRRDVMTGKDWGGMFIVDQMQIIEKNGVFEVGNFFVSSHNAKFWGKGSEVIHDLNRFITVDYPNNRHTVTEVAGNPNSRYYAIYLKNYGRIFLLDDAMYNSLFVQLFMLERHDPELLELVSANAWAKAWRIKK